MAGDFMSAQPGGDDDGHSPDEDTAEDNRAPPPASGFGGFTTAGGRKLEVSKEALHRASRLLNDNDDDDNETTAAAAGSPPDTARDEAMDLEAEQQQEPFVGFRSGRGKAVVVSEASLAKARHLVMDRDDGNDAAEAGPLSPEDSAPPAFVGFTTGSGRRLEPPKASVEQAMKRFLSDDGVGDGTYEESLAGQHATTSGEAPPEAFVGFTTGSGRRLRPAAENVKRAMDRLLADDDDGDDDSHANGNHPNRAPPAFAGFTTGSGKRLAPPKASVEQAMKRFLDDDGDGDGSSGVNAGAPTSAFVGFTTGSGRRLEPPKASVEQAMKRLLNDDDDDDGEGNGNAAQQSPGRRGEKAGAVTLDDYDALNGPPPPESFGGAGGAAFGGFKTVSGKAINVSAAALARSRQLLADADEEGGNAQRAGKRGEKDGDGEYEPLNEPPPPSESFGGAAFGGFKTVSGKAINVSAAALARSRQLLADADADADADGEGDSAQPAGKRPRFDQDGDGDFDAINGPPPPESFGGAGGAAFGGFKTVSGKAVNVSAAALARSRQLLAEVDDDVEGGNAQSAGKRPPRENAGDDDYDALNGPPPPESFGGAGGAAFGGFKTVSGKAVNVSAAALARSRKLLADAEADVDANRDPSALAPSSPPRANASSHPDEEDEDDDADMLLELSSCADDESAPAPAARAAVAPSRAPRPAPSPLRPATATPLGPPAARSTPSSHLVPSPKPTGRSEFAYPPTPVRATPPRPTSTTAFTTSATTTTTTTTATSRAATDPPRVVVTTPRAPAAASSAGTTGQLARRGPLGGNATGDRRGGAGGAGAPPAKQYAYGCSPYKPPRAHTPARPSRRQAALAATAAPVPEAAPLPPWRYSLPEVSEKLTLKQLAANEPHDLPAPPLSEEVLRMDSDRARHYQFTCEQVFEDMRAHPAAFVLFFSPQAMAALNNPHGVGAAEMHAVLLACGANPKIISPEWTSNHYRWIVWKLAGMERRFPHQLANRHLLPHTVLHQLLYRYEREVNKAKRSALKIILERDESAGRSMILCVAAIRSYGGDAPPPPPATSSTTEGGAAAAGAGGGEGAGGGVIEVTDGWYSINAILDEALTQHMALGKIYPGLKLRVIGARLNGNDNAMSPLEATESTTLLLQVNAVRRALWHAKLGIQRKPVFPVSLRSVRPEGGLVPCVDVVVERRYPLLFLEKKLDGSFITRTSAQEEHARRLFEAKRNRLVEAKKAELEKEASAQASAVTKTKPRTRSPVSKAALAECYDGETLLGWMEGASDPYEFQQLLNPRQQAIVQHHMERSRLDKDEEFGRQLEDFIAEHPDATRTVTPFVRVRLRDCPVVVAGHQRPPRSSSSSSGSGGKSDECVLTIWRPNEEEVAEIFEEGARLRIYFLNPRPPKPAGPSDDGAAMTGGWTAKPRTLELSTTLKTRYARREGPSGVYRARQVQGLEHLHAPQQQQQQQQQRGFGEASREIDVVGVVVGVHGPHECSYKSGRPYLLTQVFLTDASGELLSVELREHPDVAVSRFPFKEAPATPTVVCLSSLAYRSYDANFGVHHASAEEATDVLLAPKGRSSPFAPAYRQLVAWAEQSREEVDAARQRVEALLTGQLVPRSSSTRPGVPVRASLVGALLPFSAVACLPRAGQPSGEWDICLWPASATPPPARFPPRPTTSSADNMDEDHHHHQQQQQQADVALYVLLDDGLARHRLALALPDIVAALDLLRPAHDHHHHLVPVERWLWRCLSSPAPAGPDPSQQQQLRDLLLADLFGGVRFPDDAGAEALSLPSPTALVGEALALALLHSTRPGAAEGTAPALPVPLPGSASPQTPPDGEAPSRPLLLACEEWDGFVAALSASLSTAYDDLEVDGEDGTQTGWWHVQSVRRRTGPPSV